MLQIIAICSCISAVCLWCGFVSACRPRIFNRISKFPGRGFRCSRCPEDHQKSQDQRTDMLGNSVKESEENIGKEETTEALNSPSKSGDGGFAETRNSKRNSSSSIKIKGEKENEGMKVITDSESRQSSKANSVKKKVDIPSENVDFDREKVSKNPEARMFKQVDNYTSITSTLSALSKSSNETYFTNSEEEKRSMKKLTGERRTEAKV